MAEPVVSILMTVYNREKYIKDAIESVLNQDYDDWELIIVDDGSSDASVEIAEKFVLKDKRIRFYRNEKNLGDYPNRNRAASYAMGKYLKYLDADDIIYPHGIKTMVNSIEKFPDAALALCRSDDDLIPMPYSLSVRESFSEHFFKKPLFTNSPLGAIIKRSAFEEIGGFSGKRYVGDYEMWMELGLRYPVVKMVPGLAFWRSHGDQELVKGTESFQYPVLTDELIADFLSRENLPFDEHERKKAWKLYRLAIKKKIIRLCLKGRIRLSWKYYSAHKMKLKEFFSF